MNKNILLALVTMVGLIGCSATQEPTFSGEIVELKSSQLHQYWEHDSSQMIRLSGRPDWLPKGAGKASYFVTIDSNGVEVSKELINSIPEGWMTQKLLNKMPKQQYKAAKNNPNKTPVKVKILSEVKQMN
ncbi:hypothetical protein ACFOD0_02835 [Shewanella intestini]|uniref:Energy transducer TonB n=1 Tax=Shewanella intestini TaxID=2017544 RepID=A0ABS5I2M1_9GAMM|nr:MULTISPECIES: hypothetical protein [Shewanella]MBR9727934.1 hypothetical protein [Shewanella intestini]MRG36515.1 hypothetical protein [Shewanella sp. XMDDZSB0408]